MRKFSLAFCLRAKANESPKPGVGRLVPGNSAKLTYSKMNYKMYICEVGPRKLLQITMLQLRFW